jgi:hypothetical protein
MGDRAPTDNLTLLNFVSLGASATRTPAKIPRSGGLSPRSDSVRAATTSIASAFHPELAREQIEAEKQKRKDDLRARVQAEVERQREALRQKKQQEDQQRLEKSVLAEVDRQKEEVKRRQARLEAEQIKLTENVKRRAAENQNTAAIEQLEREYAAKTQQVEEEKRLKLAQDKLTRQKELELQQIKEAAEARRKAEEREAMQREADERRLRDAELEKQQRQQVQEEIQKRVEADNAQRPISNNFLLQKRVELEVHKQVKLLPANITTDRSLLNRLKENMNDEEGRAYTGETGTSRLDRNRHDAEVTHISLFCYAKAFSPSCMRTMYLLRVGVGM